MSPLNTGPLDHSSNYPLRAGKGSEFEGGYRVWAMASGPMVPEAVRGTQYDGMMHTSDWLPTLVGEDAVSGIPLNVAPSSRYALARAFVVVRWSTARIVASIGPVFLFCSTTPLQTSRWS